MNKEQLDRIAAELAASKAREKESNARLKALEMQSAKERAASHLALARSLVVGRAPDGAVLKFGLPEPKKTIPILQALFGAAEGRTVELERGSPIAVAECLADLLVMIQTDGLVPISEVVLERDKKTEEDEEGVGFAKRQGEKRGLIKPEKDEDSKGDKD